MTMPYAPIMPNSIAGRLPALAPHTDQLLTVGIDVGGTKTAYVVTDADDRVLLHAVVPTDTTRLAGQLGDLIRGAVARCSADDGDRVAAVGVAVPGHVEPDTGTIRLAVNLGGNRDGSAMRLGPMLAESVGLPCYVEHDARAAASWIESSGADGDVPLDLAYLSVGTGISAGIVLNGRVLRGANGLAGEVGHVSADPDDGRCACGLIGCLEHVTAGPAIVRMVHEALASGRQSTLGPDATPTDVFRAAEAGDQLAAELATTVAERLGRAIRSLVLTLGVSYVVIGGGVAGAGEALLRPVLEAIGRERAASPLVEAAFADTRVVILSPNVEAGARGVAAIARRRVLADRREGVGER
ncbi:MAG TPA: ROK family protein [Candidatus Limnocylindrales bacterium]